MRSGTRTALKKRWTPLGHRPITPVNIGYEYLYLYAAINPYTGHLVALLLPNMTKQCFRIFMEFFHQEVSSIYGHKTVLIIADGASNHQSDTIASDTITLEKLPTGCPELNPVERFFEQLRTELSNRVFLNREQVQDYMCKILKNYFDNPKTVKSLTLFPYIRHD